VALSQSPNPARDDHFLQLQEKGEATVFNTVVRAIRTDKESMVCGLQFTVSGFTRPFISILSQYRSQRDLSLQRLMQREGEYDEEYQIKDHKVALIVLDMIMNPGMDGLETYRRILEITTGQKAVIVSGYSDTDQMKEAQRLEAGAYIKKPYVTEKIGLAVRHELDRPFHP
jgi:CheY-like chemotaxis protein